MEKYILNIYSMLMGDKNLLQINSLSVDIVTYNNIISAHSNDETLFFVDTENVEYSIDFKYVSFIVAVEKLDT